MPRHDRPRHTHDTMDDGARIRWGLGTAALAPMAWLLSASILRSGATTPVLAIGGAQIMVAFAPVLAGVGVSMALDTSSRPLVSRWLSKAAIVAGIAAAPFTWMAV